MEDKKQFLYVDDEQVTGGFIIRALGPSWDVTECNEPRRAKKVIAEGHFDAALIDVRLNVYDEDYSSLAIAGELIKRGVNYGFITAAIRQSDRNMAISLGVPIYDLIDDVRRLGFDGIVREILTWNQGRRGEKLN